MSLGNAPPPKPGVTAKPPKVYKIKITKVAEINPEYVEESLCPSYLLMTMLVRVLSRFLQGAQTHDNDVLTAITVSKITDYLEATLIRHPGSQRRREARTDVTLALQRP